MIKARVAWLFIAKRHKVPPYSIGVRWVARFDEREISYKLSLATNVFAQPLARMHNKVILKGGVKISISQREHSALLELKVSARSQRGGETRLGHIW